MSTRRSQGALLIVSIVCVPLAVVLYAWPKANKHIATQDYCLGCHADSGEHLGGHDSMDCRKCHAVPEEETFAQVMAIVGAAMPEHGEVLPASCENCHSENEGTWNVLMRTDGHASHIQEPVSVRCVRCHSSSLHGEPSEEEDCASCHESTIAESVQDNNFECGTCHFFGGDTARPEAQADAWGAEITSANVHGVADCRLCHNPHGTDAPEKVDCLSCHRGELARSNATAPENHQECGTCHRAHGPRAELPTACAVCHQDPPRVRGNDRDPGVRPDRVGLSTIVPILEALTEPPPAPEGVTHEGRCATCHEPHAWRPGTDTCTECHEEQTTAIAALRADTHSCFGCHEPHSEAPGKESCAQCHRANTIASRSAPGRHRDCLSCHNPHDGKPRALSTCGPRCHSEQLAGLREGGARHQNCSNCHQTHGNPVAGTTAKCASCHRQQSQQFSRNRHETCNKCHSSHQFTAARATSQCGVCHEAPRAANASHPGECTDCHNTHAAGAGRAANCAGCHEDVQPRVRAHARNCAGCHTPHAPKAAALGQCASCHASEAAASQRWRSDIPHGANRCSECHSAHNEGRPRECGSCHGEQNSPAHTGSHTECVGCHQPHRAPPANSAGWWNRCGTCHTDEARRAASGRTEHQECQNCHDHPRREPPTCLSCHTGIPRLGAHQQEEHRECTTCHASHGTAAPTRTACLSCHRDRRDHFSDAPVCQSCHPFADE